MSGTITSTYSAALTLTSARFADPVTNLGTISLTTAGPALYAATGWTVVNEALIAAAPSATSYGILLAAGGAVTNAARAVVVGGRAIDIRGAAGSVLNAGTLAGSRYAGVELDAGGYVSNAAAAVITGGTRAVSIASAPGQVFNAGLITDTTRGAIVLTDGGSVTNAATGTIESNGTLGGPVGAGIKLYGGVGTVTNAGSIFSGNAAGVAIYGGGTVSNASHGRIAGYIGVYAEMVAPAIVNAGYIAGTQSVGVFLSGGGAVTNLATATITGVFSGIYGLPGDPAPTVVNDGVVASTLKSGIALFAGGTVVNQAEGTITGYLSGIHFESGGGTLVNAGTVGPAHGANAAVTFAAGYSNRLVVEPGAVFLGRVVGGNTIGAAATSTLELAAGAGTLTGIGASVVDFAAITFDPGAAWLLAGSTGALAGGETIFGFAPGDTLELVGVAASYSAFAAGALTLSNGSTLDLSGVASLAAGQVTNSSGNTFITACFASGTAIATEFGPIAVEALAVGDLVLSASGRLSPIRWIGHRRVDLRRHPRPHDVLPVRVMTGAFGDGLPVRDLVLSPDHAVFLDGALVPVRHLVNGASIAQEQRDHVTYWHVELERHDVILAEGLACESYLDTGNRGAFENADGPADLHPDFARATWAAGGCATILTDPADCQLRALHTRLLARAQNRKTPLPSAWRSKSW